MSNLLPLEGQDQEQGAWMAVHCTWSCPRQQSGDPVRRETLGTGDAENPSSAHGWKWAQEQEDLMGKGRPRETSPKIGGGDNGC